MALNGVEVYAHNLRPNDVVIIYGHVGFGSKKPTKKNEFSQKKKGSEGNRRSALWTNSLHISSLNTKCLNLR